MPTTPSLQELETLVNDYRASIKYWGDPIHHPGMTGAKVEAARAAVVSFCTNNPTLAEQARKDWPEE